MEPNIIINPNTEEQPDKDGWYLDRTRRVAILWIDENIVLDVMLQFFNGKFNDNEFQMRLIDGSLPKGVKVLRATHSWDRRAVGFLLAHLSFEAVPEGCPPPDLTYTRLVWEYIPKESFSTPPGYIKTVTRVDPLGILEVTFTRHTDTVFFSKEDK